MFAAIYRCLALVSLAACTMPTEVVVEPSSSSSADADGGDGSSDLPTATCSPVSVAGWSPEWVPATGASQGACAASDITNLYGSCFGASATQATCSAYQSNSSTCASCALSASTDASWGPIVVFGGMSIVNQSGCLALVEPAAAACATSSQALTECEHAQCDPNCPVSDAASLSAWQQCAAQADTGACAGYKSSCLTSALSADGGATACAGADFATMFVNVTTVFCGSSN